MLLEALVTTGMVLFILFLLPLGERVILPPPSSNIRHVHIKVAAISGQLISDIYDTCTDNKVIIDKLNVVHEKDENEIGIICRIPNQETIAKVIGDLHSLTGIKNIEANVQPPDA